MNAISERLPAIPTQNLSFFPSAFDQVNWMDVLDDDHEDSNAMDLDPFHPSQQTMIISSASDQQDPATVQDYPALQLSSGVWNCFRARGIPATDGERFRPIIVQLYRDENRKLEDVRRIMQQRHLFYATVQMYKKRFVAWGIRKNYSQEQKEEVLLLQEGTPGTISKTCNERALPILLNSKPVKHHRIERYRRQKARCRKHQPYDQVSRFEPQHSTEYRKAELCLLEVEYYFAHCIDRPNSKLLLEGPAVHADVVDCIILGCDTLRRDLLQAFAWFNRACVNVPAMFTDGCFEIMQHLLQLFRRGGRWEWYDEIRRALLQYFKAAGRRVLGEHHPITTIVSILKQDFAWVDAMQRVADMVLASSKQNSGLNAENEELLTLRARSCMTYAHIGKFDVATEEISHLIDECERCFPLSHLFLQFAKFELGYFHYKRKALYEAETQWLEVIKLCVTHTGRGNGTGHGARSCGSLGWIYEDEGRDNEAERYLRLAVEGALEEWGPTDA